MRDPIDVTADLRRALSETGHEHLLDELLEHHSARVRELHLACNREVERRREAERKGLPSFQRRVFDWMIPCFGERITIDINERCKRFYEEATELVQAAGMSREEAGEVADYTFARPAGEVPQEVAGTLVTLASFCIPFRIDISQVAEEEMVRIWEKMDTIRSKQANKPASVRGSASVVVTEGEERRQCESKVDDPADSRRMIYMTEDGNIHYLVGFQKKICVGDEVFNAGKPITFDAAPALLSMTPGTLRGVARSFKTGDSSNLYPIAKLSNLSAVPKGGHPAQYGSQVVIDKSDFYHFLKTVGIDLETAKESDIQAARERFLPSPSANERARS